MKSPRYFECKNKNSAKFWEISIEDSKFSVRYGKIGTAGKEQTKEFDSADETLKNAEKTIKSKIKKGYVEIVNDSSCNKKSLYEDLLNATDLQKALCEHFSYLADMPGSESMLAAIMAKAKSVIYKNEELIVHFPDDEEDDDDNARKLYARAPATDLSKYQAWPKSFQKYMAVHVTFPL